MVARQDYLQGLTGVRGLAAFWVLVYHVWTFFVLNRITAQVGDVTIDLTPFSSAGWSGVDLFFVLSGFLLSLPFVRAELIGVPRPSLRAFFQRRVLRVFPAYYAQLLVLIPLALAAKLGPVPSLANIAAHLVMAHNFVYEHSGAINSPYWTMPAEWNFYLAFPLLIVWIRPGRWPWLAAIAVAATVAYRLLVHAYAQNASIHTPIWVIEQFPGRVDQFVFGMIGAYVFVRSSNWGERFPRERASDVLGVLAVVGGIALIYLLHWHIEVYFGGHWTLYVWHSLFGAVTAALLVAVAWNGPLMRALLANRAIVGLGIISYSVYLWHYPLLLWILRSGWADALPARGMAIMLPLALALVVPLSWISYRLIERPFLQASVARMPRLVAVGRGSPWIFFGICAVVLFLWAAAWRALLG